MIVGDGRVSTLTVIQLLIPSMQIRFHWMTASSGLCIPVYHEEREVNRS